MCIAETFDTANLAYRFGRRLGDAVRRSFKKGFNRVARDGVVEPLSLIALKGVYSDDLSLVVEQRTARIAGVYCRLRLDDICAMRNVFPLFFHSYLGLIWLMVPVVYVHTSPSGCPIAWTSSPTSSLEMSPIERGCSRREGASTFSIARSEVSSTLIGIAA